METNTTEKIKIESRRRPGNTYYIDANGILEGEWGGYHESCGEGPNGEIVHEIYYSKYSKYVPINEFGFFYNRFSCKKYDGVIKIDTFYLCENRSAFNLIPPSEDGSLYYAEKNKRFGIIDANGHELLHVCYKKIVRVSTTPVFFVSCETGEFIYNVETGHQSRVHESLQAIDSNYIRFKQGSGYGLLDYKGNIIIKPIFEERDDFWYRFDKSQLQIRFKNYSLGVYIQNDEFYGEVSPYEYDWCAKVDLHETMMGLFYITSRGGKYGIINRMFKCVSLPLLDDIIFVNTNQYPRPYSVLNEKIYSFIIAKKNNEFILFNTTKCEIVISGCSKMDYKYNKRISCSDYIEYEKDNHVGYVTRMGMILDNKLYDSVERYTCYFIVSINGKFGVLDNIGREVFPCENETKEIVLTKIEEKEAEYERIEQYKNHEFQHYYEYTGSYAQDEMGYSDEDIDTIFDGDPSAYWNID